MLHMDSLPHPIDVLVLVLAPPLGCLQSGGSDAPRAWWPCTRLCEIAIMLNVDVGVD